MLVADLVRVMETIAPPEFAEEWDKIGLLVGDRQRGLSGPVLLTIDLTEPVLHEAIAMKAGAVIAYHPVIWDELRRVTSETPRQRIVLRAIEHGMSIYCPHTALDAVPGGIADWLCEGLSGSKEPGRVAGDVRALKPYSDRPSTQEVKIVTFVPTTAVDAVRNALASAGAGIIGPYRLCSFAASGTGTFFGDEGAAPTVGQAGRLEQVSEVRLEMVCSRSALAIAVETLRRFHPYQEPAIDVYALEPHPKRHIGPGRRLVLDRPTRPSEIAQRLKAFIGRERVRLALPGDDRPITHIGVCPGSGGSMARIARAEGAELYVTGELGHHDVIGALHSGMGVLVGGHTNTERGYLPRLREQMLKHASHLDVRLSSADVDPLNVV